MTCDILNIPFEPIEVNLPTKEHLTADHAILMYLVDKYGKDDSLYPKDLKKRALVNQKLFFDTGILFARLKNMVVSVFYEGATSLSEKQLRDVYEAYGFLEEFLTRSKYLAGDGITIADISAITYVTSIVYVLPLDAKIYPKTAAWIKDLEQKPYCQKYNARGTALLGERIRQAFK
ncbi:Glutathione S-transferase 10 [Operophtera brumata]|uniref:Glutathione S-transferase 10 n=1 Tax=Operophtera brumata TaxID=104452 RepID=A0A0L7KLM3_OPEBR|nr:Glutathione S-transferase 10 [Operophtera brumata]